MKKRLILFLVGGEAWSGPVPWRDDEDEERLARVAEVGHWDEDERMFVPACSIVRAAVMLDDEEVFDE